MKNQQFNISKLHRLAQQWTFLWSHSHSPYESLSCFHSIEGFLQHYEFFKKPSQLSAGLKFSIFKADKFPCQEDYPNGGCWIVQVSRKEEQKMDSIWEEMVFRTVGSNMSKMLGVQCHARNRDVLLEIWMQNQSIRNSIHNEILHSILRKHKRSYFMPFIPIPT